MSRALALVVTAALATWPYEAAAHEVGTTAVTATLDGRRYTVQVTLDAATLVAKLDAAAGRPRTRPLESDEYRRTIERRGNEFLRHVTVLFDGQPAAPSLESVTEVATDSADADESLPAPRVCVRLSGDVPRGVRTFLWSYDLTFASYAFIVRRAAGPVGRVEWLEGGQPSSPFELGAPALLGAGSFQPGRAAIPCGALLMLAVALGRRTLPHIQIRLRPVERRCRFQAPAAPGPLSSRSRV
jgi:hypothetical protein